MKGQKPKPLALKLAEGDRGKRGIRKLKAALEAEPKAEAGLADCPAHLTGLAAEAWAYWSDQLALMNLDKKPDAQALTAACIAFENMCVAYETVNREGRIVERKRLDPSTNEFVVVGLVPHPACAQGDRAAALLRGFCSEFGFTPVSRTRLAVQPVDKGVDELERLLCLGLPPEKF